MDTTHKTVTMGDYAFGYTVAEVPRVAWYNDMRGVYALCIGSVVCAVIHCFGV